MQQSPNRYASVPGFSRSMLAFIVFLGIALFFLLSEHRIHALGWLPLLLLAACPLLHMFHHGGHGGHVRHAEEGKGHAGHGTASPGTDPPVQRAGETI